MGALRDPPADQLDLLRRELFLACVGWGHTDGGVVRRNAADHFALVRIARDYGKPAVRQRDLSATFQIEAELGFSVGGVRAVAGEATVRENGPYVAIELDRLRENRG